MVYTIVSNIKHNAKRMQKLNSMTAWKAREQAHRYVVGEAATLKVKLTEDEIIHAAVMLVG